MGEMMTIGIAGGTGSGKTTITRKILREFGQDVSVVYHDNYYKAHDELPYEEETVVTEFVDAAYEPITEDEPADDEPADWDEADDLSDTAVTEPVADEAEKDLEPVDDLEEPEPAADADSADDFDDLDDPDDPEPAEDQDPDPDSDPEDDDPWGMKDVPRPHLVR